ncbi:MAG: hypothetical protein ACREAE_00775 [Nitrosopumilaceae archaeon]
MRSILFAFLLVIFSAIFSLNTVFAEETGWKTFTLIEKYTNSDPQLPDRGFVAQYRVINGTISSIEGNEQHIIAKVQPTTEKGIFELKFPRNFPYANDYGREEFFIGINGYGAWHYYHPEEDIVLPHVREKLLNKVNRPPPYPETFSEKTDCYFVFSIPFYTYAEIEIGYGFNGLIQSPYLGDEVPEHCVNETIYLPSPLKQFKSGIQLEEIQCKEGLQLIIKSRDGSPACVKPDTATKLVERGWGDEIWSTSPETPYTPKEQELHEETFLSKTRQQWQSMSEEQLEPHYNKYKDDFFTELGRFLIKDEMQKELQRNGIENKYKDFRVFSGGVLTSLPPHISYQAVVNATDGNSYLLEGGTFANRIEALRINQLAFYSEVLNPPKIGSGRTPPAWGLLFMEPKIIISPQEGNAPIVEPYSLILDLEKNNLVTFYNNLTVPIRIQEESSGFVEDEDKISWKGTIIAPKQSVSIQFNVTGHYQWNARSPPNASEQWWGYQGGGEIAAFSNETQNISFEEKMAIARVFLYNSRPDVPWTGMGSNNDGIDIMLNDAIFYMIPDAERYYKARAQQWVPFDVPIIIEAPKTLEVPKSLEK